MSACQNHMVLAGCRPLPSRLLPRTQSSPPIPTRNPSEVSAGGRGTLLRSAPKRASSRQFPVLAVRSMCSQQRLSSSAPSSWNAQAPANAATGKPTRRTKSARPSTPVPAKDLPPHRPRKIFDRDKVVELRRQGLSLRRIAREMGLGVGTVHRTLQARSKSC